MQPINQAANAMILPMVVAVVVFNLPAGVNMPAAMQWQTGWKRGSGFPHFLASRQKILLSHKVFPKIDANVGIGSDLNSIYSLSNLELRIILNWPLNISH